MLRPASHLFLRQPFRPRIRWIGNWGNRYSSSGADAKTQGISSLEKVFLWVGTASWSAYIFETHYGVERLSDPSDSSEVFRLKSQTKKIIDSAIQAMARRQAECHLELRLRFSDISLVDQSNCEGITRIDSTSARLFPDTSGSLASRSCTEVKALNIEGPGDSWLFGVFDGHNSGAISFNAANHLFATIARMIEMHPPEEGTKRYMSSEGSNLIPSQDALSSKYSLLAVSDKLAGIIRAAFHEADRRGVGSLPTRLFRHLEEQDGQYRNSETPNSSLNMDGIIHAHHTYSSGLVGVYDGSAGVCHIALAGDSRAVLGRPYANPGFKDSSSAASTFNTTLSPKLLQNRSPLRRVPQGVTSQVELEREPVLDPRSSHEYPLLYQVHPLTLEHVPSNPAERARIQSLHPDYHEKLFQSEPSDIQSNIHSDIPVDPTTYLGLSVTRAFGYGALKWSLEAQERMHRELMGEISPPSFFTDGTLPIPPSDPFQGSDSHPSLEISSKMGPVHSDVSPRKAFHDQTSNTGEAVNPYLTCEPEITTVKVQPGDFLILGSRGLFECLSNEEAVGLVGAWLEERRLQNKGVRDVIVRSGYVRAPNPKDGGKNYWIGSSRDRVLQALITGLEKLSDSIAESARRQLKARTGSHYESLLEFMHTEVHLPLKPFQPSRLVVPSELPVATPSAPTKDTILPSGWRWQHSWGIPKTDVKFTIHEQDLDNVSVHLARNALGGADVNLRKVLLDIQGREASDFRDNISVQVVFFE